MKKLVIPKGVTIYVDGQIVIENDISSALGVPKVMTIAERPEYPHVFIGSDNLKVDDIICDGELLAKGEIFLEGWRDKK